LAVWGCKRTTYVHAITSSLIEPLLLLSGAYY
jgi:hypothetical protein